MSLRNPFRVRLAWACLTGIIVMACWRDHCRSARPVSSSPRCLRTDPQQPQGASTASIQRIIAGRLHQRQWRGLVHQPTCGAHCHDPDGRDVGLPISPPVAAIRTRRQNWPRTWCRPTQITLCNHVFSFRMASRSRRSPTFLVARLQPATRGFTGPATIGGSRPAPPPSDPARIIFRQHPTMFPSTAQGRLHLRITHVASLWQCAGNRPATDPGLWHVRLITSLPRWMRSTPIGVLGLFT